MMNRSQKKDPKILSERRNKKTRWWKIKIAQSDNLSIEPKKTFKIEDGTEAGDMIIENDRLKTTLLILN